MAGIVRIGVSSSVVLVVASLYQQQQHQQQQQRYKKHCISGPCDQALQSKYFSREQKNEKIEDKHRISSQIPAFCEYEKKIQKK